QLGVVRWQDTCLADLLCPPAQVRHAVLERASRQPFSLPALQQGFDVLALERGGPHLAETRFAQLASSQTQRPLPVGLGGVATVAVAQAKLAQGIGQVVHCGVVPSVVGAEKQTVSVFANSPRQDPEGPGPGPGPGAQFTCGRE